MPGKLLIDAHYSNEIRVAVIGEDGKLENFEAEYSGKRPIKGNVYLAKVVRIEPALQVAFIDYGGEKHGFLPLSEIHYDYFSKNIMKTMESEDSPNSDKKYRRKTPKIQEVISVNQIILVQAEKEIKGNKCASFTTFISLPGRYCVLMPNPQKGKGNAVSKKIDTAEKERLREVVNALAVPDGMSCIIRTAGINRTKQDIKRDLGYLCRLWNELREKVTASIAPDLIYEEGNIIKRSLRDLYQGTIESVIIQGEKAYKEARTFMKIFTPSHVKRIKLYSDNGLPIFHKYEIEDEIGRMLNPVVLLSSGGSIVINTMEALTAIDVNSGKSKDERNIEDTALKTNLEATVEIARQIKLRNISGIIVIDFIDMKDPQARTKIEKKMREIMKNDYSNTQFGKISQFGLMELSRQRLRMSLTESNFIQCKHCAGSGKILSNEATALSVIQKIEKDLVGQDAKFVVAEVAIGVDLFVLNHRRKLLSELETKYGTFIEIARNRSLSSTDCKVTVKEYKQNTPLEVKQTFEPARTIPKKMNEFNSKKLVNKTNVKFQDTPSEVKQTFESTKTIPKKTNEFDSKKLVNKTNVKFQMKAKEQKVDIKENVVVKKRKRRKPKDLTKNVINTENQTEVQLGLETANAKPRKKHKSTYPNKSVINVDVGT